MKISRVAQGLFAALVATAAVGAAPATSLAVPVSADQVSAAAVGNTLVYKEKTEGYDCFRIPAVVKANNGELLAFAEGRKGGASFCNDRGDIDLVVKRSADNGKTWSAPKIVIEGFGDTKGNPTPIVIPSTGRIVLLSVMECVKNPDCNRIPRVSISDDHGKTWTAPKVLTTQLGFSSAPGWLATGPSHGIVLTRGAHAGRIVAGMSYTIGTANSGALIYSDDQGVTWKWPVPSRFTVKTASDFRTRSSRTKTSFFPSGDHCGSRSHELPGVSCVTCRRPEPSAPTTQMPMFVV